MTLYSKKMNEKKMVKNQKKKKKKETENCSRPEKDIWTLQKFSKIKHPTKNIRGTYSEWRNNHRTIFVVVLTHAHTLYMY